MTRATWRSRLAAFLLLVGVVLSPLRAVAAAVLQLTAYDGAAEATATPRVEAGPSLRPELGAVPEYIYDAVHVGYDSVASPQVVGGAGAVLAYDDALNLADQREGDEGVIYATPSATLN